jgi:uncharacterized protein YbaR (Trm112 family)
MDMDRELLDVLACPKCRGKVRERGMFLLCEKCGLAFPFLDGVPDMLLEDAWKLEKARKAGFRHKLRL